MTLCAESGGKRSEQAQSCFYNMNTITVWPNWEPHGPPRAEMSFLWPLYGYTQQMLLFFHADSLANTGIIFPLDKFLLKIKFNLFWGKCLESLDRYVMIWIWWYQWATVISSNGWSISGIFSLIRALRGLEPLSFSVSISPSYPP